VPGAIDVEELTALAHAASPPDVDLGLGDKLEVEEEGVAATAGGGGPRLKPVK